MEIMIKTFKKIFLDNFYLVYFISLNVVLIIKMTTNKNDSANEYLFYGFFIYGVILLAKFENKDIKSINKDIKRVVFLLLISMLILLILNYKHYVNIIFIIKNHFAFSIYILFLYLWIILEYKYYKNGIFLITFKTIGHAKVDEVTIVNFIFSILLFLLFLFLAWYLSR